MEVILLGKSFSMWLERPFRRMIVNTIIFGVSLVAAIVPVLSIFVLPWLAWWAIADYYDYEFEVSPAFDKFFEPLLL